MISLKGRLPLWSISPSQVRIYLPSASIMQTCGRMQEVPLYLCGGPRRGIKKFLPPAAAMPESKVF